MYSIGTFSVPILSIHAPTRGATFFMLFSSSSSNFQSTLLQEERLEPITLYDVPKRLSIHAPTRGATNTPKTSSDVLDLSIHAPTRGATAKMHNIPYASLQ